MGSKVYPPVKFDEELDFEVHFVLRARLMVDLCDLSQTYEGTVMLTFALASPAIRNRWRHVTRGKI